MRLCYYLLYKVLPFCGEPCLKNLLKNQQHTQNLLLFLRGPPWLLYTVTKAKNFMKEDKMDFFFSSISYSSPAHNSIHARGKVAHLKEVLTMTLTQLLNRSPSGAGRAPCTEQDGSFHSPLLHIYYLIPQQQSTGLHTCPCTNCIQVSHIHA